jgi:CNT family concentrative nucleoside transporter
MVEAPLCIRPYLGKLTRSELFVLMTAGMAGIAGTVLVLYATMLGPTIPGAAGHLVVASVLDAPAAIGTAAGLELLLNICAMLIVLIALVHLVNAMLGLVPEVVGAPVTLERMLGIAMAPVCWLIGIPWGEAVTAGRRRDDVVSLGFKSIASGTLATCLVGAVVGVLT